MILAHYGINWVHYYECCSVEGGVVILESYRRHKERDQHPAPDYQVRRFCDAEGKSGVDIAHYKATGEVRRYARDHVDLIGVGLIRIMEDQTEKQQPSGRSSPPVIYGKEESNMKPLHLGQLRQRLPNHPHMIADQSWKGLEMENHEWLRYNSPYIWHCQAIAESARVYVDSGYGHIALFVNDFLVDVTRSGSVVWGEGYAAICAGDLSEISIYKEI
jgi:hypothetical protein